MGTLESRITIKIDFVSDYVISYNVKKWEKERRDASTRR